MSCTLCFFVLSKTAVTGYVSALTVTSCRRKTYRPPGWLWTIPEHLFLQTELVINTVCSLGKEKCFICCGTQDRYPCAIRICLIFWLILLNRTFLGHASPFALWRQEHFPSSVRIVRVSKQAVWNYILRDHCAAAQWPNVSNMAEKDVISPLPIGMSTGLLDPAVFAPLLETLTVCNMQGLCTYIHVCHLAQESQMVVYSSLRAQAVQVAQVPWTHLFLHCLWHRETTVVTCRGMYIHMYMCVIWPRSHLYSSVF